MFHQHLYKNKNNLLINFNGIIDCLFTSMNFCNKGFLFK